jgi:hypothetical protein
METLVKSAPPVSAKGGHNGAWGGRESVRIGETPGTARAGSSHPRVQRNATKRIGRYRCLSPVSPVAGSATSVGYRDDENRTVQTDVIDNLKRKLFGDDIPIVSADPWMRRWVNENPVEGLFDPIAEIFSDGFRVGGVPGAMIVCSRRARR